MGKSERIELLQALAVTAELTGTQLSDSAARVLANDLSAYPVAQVLGALTRCRRELRTRLTVAAIIERLDDGRPGPEEAWAMIPQDEAGSVVWTSEMAEAYGVAAPLIKAGDMIGARMAFRETYIAIVTRARAEQLPPSWMPSLGFDPSGREAAIETAVRKGRIGQAAAQRLLPTPVTMPLLEQQAEPMPEEVRAKIYSFIGKRRTA